MEPRYYMTLMEAFNDLTEEGFYTNDFRFFERRVDGVTVTVEPCYTEYRWEATFYA